MTADAQTMLDEDMAIYCVSCAEGGIPFGECPKSKFSVCRHHCNHTWTHAARCWCGEEIGGEEGS